MVNILMASKWHVHAAGYARFAQEQADAKITCVWDEDRERGEAWAKELSVPYELDLEKALARSDVDAVIVDAPTCDHEKVIMAAINAGKHIFTEKALAPTLDACKRIEKAANDKGIKLCVSMPHLNFPLFQYCRQAIDEGWLGQVHYMRYRNAHNGASGGWLPEYWYDPRTSCGGAMMDLGCHPMYIASYLLGKPARVASMFNRLMAPGTNEDNAVSVVEFENKAIAVLETSFVSPFDAGCFELLGTEGAIVQVDGKVRVRAKQHGEGWFYPAKLPAEKDAAMRVWLDAIQNGADMSLFTADRGTALTELLESAYASHNEGKIAKI